MLIVTMPTTPEEGSLGVTEEASEIKDSLQVFSTVKILERPTAGHVLQALPGYSTVEPVLLHDARLGAFDAVREVMRYWRKSEK